MALAYPAFTGIGRGQGGARINAVAHWLAEALVRGPFHPPVDGSAVLGSPPGSLLLALTLALALGRAVAGLPGRSCRWRWSA